MKTHLVKLQHGNRILIPDEVMDELDLRPGKTLILKLDKNNKGMFICRPNMFDLVEHDLNALDDDFEMLDDELRKKAALIKDIVKKIL